MLTLKWKKLHPLAVIPTKAHKTDAGRDLTATGIEKSLTNGFVYHTGLAVEIPEGYVGLVFPRSSNRKTDCYLTNHVGVIDSGYRGEILLTYKNRDAGIFNPPYNIGDRIGQILIVKLDEFTDVEVDELSSSDRGENGHGSTGK